MNKTIIFTLLMLTIGCRPNIDRTHEISGKLSQTYTDSFDWQNSSPFDLLNELKTTTSDVFWIGCFHHDWIKQNDIPKLLKLIDSEESCTMVRSKWSNSYDYTFSYNPCPRSTIGREATFLIEGFRQKKYPPEFNSLAFKYDRDEVHDWWNKNRKNPTNSSTLR